MKTVAELRKEGYRVRVKHLRLYIDQNGEPWLKHKSEASAGDILDAKGGETQLQITTPGGEHFFECAVCRPNIYYDNVEKKFLPQKGDAFNRKLWLRIALGRFEKKIKRSTSIETPKQIDYIVY